MTSVLVSGAAPPVARFAEALRASGADVTTVSDLGEMTAVCQAAGAEAFDAYVQLPSTFEMQGDTAIERVHHFYANGVLARYPALAAAVPVLAPTATVVFVLADLPAEVASQEDRDARESLTKVLAHAARADATYATIAVHILGPEASTDEVVDAALGRRSVSPDLDRLSELDYADWRVEVLGLAALET